MDPAATAAPNDAAPAAKKRERGGWRENTRREHKAAQAEKQQVRAVQACALVLLICPNTLLPYPDAQSLPPAPVRPKKPGVPCLHPTAFKQPQPF